MAIYREIGTGTQGMVFEDQDPESIYCYKLQLPGSKIILWNNYVQRLNVKEAFDAAAKAGLRIDVQCPKAKEWFTPDTSSFWNETVDVDKFEWPQNASKMKGKTHHGFAMERIFPVPEPFRHELIDKYFGEQYKENAKADPRNGDCLIRIYLGIEEPLRSARFLKLRNFPMDIARTKAGRLPGHQYAEAIAGAMAVLHWQAKVDADDVEFVLGGSPRNIRRVQPTLEDVEKLGPHNETCSMVYGHQEPDLKDRTTALWVMDFDRCRNITLDKAGVEAAVKAMDRNYYCPKTGSGNDFMERLWDIFREHYIEVSQKLLPDGSHLAESFIEGFKTHCAEYFKRRAEYAEAGFS
ncbi:hypothetical protein PRZ48_001583 [Zasmidium cellare]|uniref:DUF3669 domain-containing protein n=1 Tax=Zasmidium cellare TaxID=395010 RepID=A0ABR0F433_ZASCE|nr:hypothetical protein PRZ48_001583 [Zasmidium cellare]